MTTKKISDLINKAVRSFENGYYIESCILCHILIKEEFLILYKQINGLQTSKGLKFSSALSYQLSSENNASKKVIKKSTLKSILIWKKKYDTFYKQLKKSLPADGKMLCEEALVIGKALNVLIHRYNSNLSRN